MSDQISQADWDSVTAEIADGTAPAPAAAQPEVDPVVVPEPIAETADPYEGLSPDVKARLEKFDELSSLFPQVVQTLKETQGRVSSLQSEFAKRQASPAVDAPTQAQVARATQDPEKWASLKKDFPEWGEGIEAFVGARVDALAGSGLTAEQVEARIATGVTEGLGRMGAEIQHEFVAMKYPSWDAIVKTPAFETWFKGQKPDVQALAQSPKGRDAVAMLDQFHEAQKAPVVRDNRKKVLAAAVTTGKAPAAPVAVKSYDDMDAKERWNFEAAERARKAEAA